MQRGNPQAKEMTTTWEAFRRRLNQLEGEIQVDQQQRRQLEQVLDDKPKLPSPQDDRLQLELREIKALNGDLNRKLQTTQSRVAELWHLNGELQVENRRLRSKYEAVQKGNDTPEHDNQQEEENCFKYSPLRTQENTCEENQRSTTELKQALDTISNLKEPAKSDQTQQWQQAEIALNEAKQAIRELQMEVEVLRNERDLVEFRASEALEEIVVLKERIAEGDKHKKQSETLLAFVECALAKKQEKIQLLTDTIVSMKDEFLHTEDRHAVEIRRATHN